MPKFYLDLYDIIQISLLLLACYACFKLGHKKGVEDTLDFFENEGIIESEDA